MQPAQIPDTEQKEEAHRKQIEEVQKKQAALAQRKQEELVQKQKERAQRRREIDEELNIVMDILSPEKLMKFIISFRNDNLNNTQIVEKIKKEIFDFYNKKLEILQKQYQSFATKTQKAQINELKEIVEDFINNPQGVIRTLDYFSKKLLEYDTKKIQAEIIINSNKKELEKKIREYSFFEGTEIFLLGQNKLLYDLSYQDESIKALIKIISAWREELNAIKMNINITKLDYFRVRKTMNLSNNNGFISIQEQKNIVLSPEQLVKSIISYKENDLNNTQIVEKLKTEIFDVHNNQLQEESKDCTTQETTEQIKQAKALTEDFKNNPQGLMNILDYFSNENTKYYSKKTKIETEIENIKIALDKEKAEYHLFAEEAMLRPTQLGSSCKYIEDKLKTIALLEGTKSALQEELNLIQLNINLINLDYFRLSEEMNLSKSKGVFSITEQINTSNFILSLTQLIKLISSYRHDNLSHKQIESKLKQEIFYVQGNKLSNIQKAYKDHITEKQKQEINKLQKIIQDFYNDPQGVIDKLESLSDKLIEHDIKKTKAEIEQINLNEQLKIAESSAKQPTIDVNKHLNSTNIIESIESIKNKKLKLEIELKTHQFEIDKINSIYCESKLKKYSNDNQDPSSSTTNRESETIPTTEPLPRNNEGVASVTNPNKRKAGASAQSETSQPPKKQGFLMADLLNLR